MHARNARTGAPIVASLESVHGRTRLVRDGFSRDADGVVERQIESPTEMLWHTSETIGYLDANDEEVDWDDIEVYEPNSTVPEAVGQNEGRDAEAGDGMRDPAARAGNTAARTVERIVAEVDNYHHEEAAAAGHGDDETTMNEALRPSRSTPAPMWRRSTSPAGSPAPESSTTRQRSRSTPTKR